MKNDKVYQLENQYTAETGKKHYAEILGDYCYYKNDYVEWLENKVIELNNTNHMLRAINGLI